MKHYYLIVNNKYFAGETEEQYEIPTQSQSPSGFFCMTTPTGLGFYSFVDDIELANKIAYCNISNYVEGIMQRQRHGLLNAKNISIIEC